MSYSLLTTIRDHGAALLAPNHRLRCGRRLWAATIRELARRGHGERESGAFLLGTRSATGTCERRRIVRVVCYDDLDPRCLDHGIVTFDGHGFPALWRLCETTGLSVVGDVHTHPGSPARQSETDRRNPMIATVGHIAVIVPEFAQGAGRAVDLGVYEYEGAHAWRAHLGTEAKRFFYIGVWG